MKLNSIFCILQLGKKLVHPYLQHINEEGNQSFPFSSPKAVYEMLPALQLSVTLYLSNSVDSLNVPSEAQS